jgi:hypothetical protein
MPIFQEKGLTLQFQAVAPVSLPPAGKIMYYANATGQLTTINSSGTVAVFAQGPTGATGATGSQGIQGI